MDGINIAITTHFETFDICCKLCGRKTPNYTDKIPTQNEHFQLVLCNLGFSKVSLLLKQIANAVIYNMLTYVYYFIQ